MPRPRKPTRLLLLTGANVAHPERMRERELEPKDERPLGPPPAWLSTEQLSAWKEIESLAPWLARADRVAVEVASVLLAAFRCEGTALAPSLIARLETTLGRLGLTPADRSRVAESPAREENPFERFKSEAGGRR
jgi:phage terminase small subunit